MLALTYAHSRSLNLQQRVSNNAPRNESKYESEDDEEYDEGRDKFDENLFGDSSVLFQSPSNFRGAVMQQQFTLNPNDNSTRANPRYMAST